MSLSNDPTPEPPFEDPALREACRRAWGGERAPAALRERVARAVRDDAPAPPAVATRWRIGPGRRLAAAAVVLLAVGGLTAYYAGLLSGPGTSSTAIPVRPAVSLIPATLAVQLAQVHELCSGHDHHGIADEDFQQIETRLRRDLGQPVLTCTPDHLDGPGDWKFRGAAVCRVGGHRAGHLVFVRDQASVSVFSLPAVACPQFPADAQCDTSGKACDIAAFRHGEGFFCVVGWSKDGSLGREQVRALRDRLRPNVVAARANAPAVARGGF